MCRVELTHARMAENPVFLFAFNSFENTAKSMWYNDIQATYDLGGWNFALGARNVFDEKPPYVSNNDDMNTIHYSYDTAGAYYYGRVTYNF